jgi:AraC family transcriptional activator of pobA
MKKLPVYGIKEFSEGENETYFYSNDLRTHLESHKFVNSPHKHNTYISILFTKGTGIHVIDFDTFDVKPGSVFLLSPGQVHSWKLSKDVKGFVFFHTKEFYDNIFINRKLDDFPFFYLQNNDPVIYLTTSEIEKIENYFVLINNEFQINNEYQLSKIGSLTDLLYIELTQVFRSKRKNSSLVKTNDLKVRKLIKLIDENYKVKKFPNEYADLMNMSIRHLNRICQESLKKSTGDLIFDRILLEAKRLLIHNDASIFSVAELLGYEDYSYFIRMFKKKVGLSPKEFQIKMLKPF